MYNGEGSGQLQIWNNLEHVPYMGIGDLEKIFINWKAYVISKCDVNGYSKKKI